MKNKCKNAVMTMLLLCVCMLAPVVKSQAAMVGGTGFDDATPISLNTTYSYDVNGHENAQISLLELDTEYIFSIEVPRQDYYVYNFKAANESGMKMVLYGSDYEKIAGTGYYNWAKYETHTDKVTLKPGTYYIGLRADGEKANGTIALYNARQDVVDLQYNLNEVANTIANKGVEASLNMQKAPRLALDNTFTFDVNGYRDANLSVPDCDHQFFYKVLIPKQGYYTYSFKVSGPESAKVRMYDCNYEFVAGTGYYNWQRQSTITDTIQLQPGVYYLGVEVDKELEAGGIISVYNATTSYTDLQYNVNEPILSSNQTGIEGSRDFQKAPRIATNSTYTFDVNSYKNANLSVPEVGDMYFYKILIPEKAKYLYNFKVATEDGAKLCLYDSNYERVAGTGYYSWTKKEALTDTITLEKGVYYIGIHVDRELNCSGSVTMTFVEKIIGTSTGNNNNNNNTNYNNTNTSTNNNKPTTVAPKKTLSIFSVKAKKGTKKVTGKVNVSGVTVKVKVGSKAYKSAKVKSTSFKLSVSKKLKKGTKIKIKATKTGYTSKTVTVKVK